MRGVLLGLLLFAALVGLLRLPYGWAPAVLLFGALGWWVERRFRLLRQRADHDPLTGLKNRRPFERRLATVSGRPPASLLFIELDNFGQINKQYGHLIGDRALISVCRLLERSTRKTDLLARWGGDEFVLLLPGTSAESALVLAERIRAMIEQNPYNHGTVTVPLSVSTGVAALEQAGSSPADLLRRAEQAHRVAKQRKNTVHLCG